jgi:hypothetical protein
MFSHTIVKGKIVYAEGEIQEELGDGKFITAMSK